MQNVIFYLSDFTGTPVAQGSTLKLTPTGSSNQVSASYIVSPIPRTEVVCNDTGSVLFATVYPQTYLCKFTDAETSHTCSFYVAVPTGSGTLNAKDLQVFTVSGSNPVLHTASLVTTNTSSSVNFFFADFMGSPIHDTLVITPLSKSVSIFGQNIITARREDTSSNCSGALTLKMIAGIYSVRLGNDAPFTIQVPDTASNYNAKDLICLVAATGSLVLAVSSSYALTASFSLNGTAGVSVSSSWASSSLSASYARSASLAISALASGFADVASNSFNSLNAGFAISSSLAQLAITSSYAPVEPAYSSSVSTLKQNTLITGNTYTITASWANNSTSASYATASTSASYAGTASNAVLAVNATNASNAFNATTANFALFASAAQSASFASQSFTSLNATQSAFATQSVYASSSLVAVSASYASASISASYSPVEPAYSASVSSVKQDTLVTGNTYSVTSSWAVNARTASCIDDVDGANRVTLAANLIPRPDFAVSVGSGSNRLFALHSYYGYFSELHPNLGGLIYLNGNLEGFGTPDTFDLGSSTNPWRNIYATRFTGSLQGTASRATIANTASYISSSATFDSAKTYVMTASFAVSASYAPSSPSVSASYAGTASVLLGSVVSASYAATASWANQGVTGSLVHTTTISGSSIRGETGRFNVLTASAFRTSGDAKVVNKLTADMIDCLFDVSIYRDLYFSTGDPVIYQTNDASSMRFGGFATNGPQFQLFGNNHGGFPGQTYYDGGSGFMRFRANAGAFNSFTAWADGKVSLRTTNSDKEIHLDGTVRLDNAGTGTPSDTVNPAGWIAINIDGADVFLPYFA